jgi:hypothetical protein
LLAFRRPVEARLQVLAPALVGISPTMVANPLVRDLDDLQAEPLPDEPFTMAFDMAGVLGMCLKAQGLERACFSKTR